jgi:hypothetical protein
MGGRMMARQIVTSDKGYPITAEQRQEIEHEVARTKGARSRATIEAELAAAKSELQHWEEKFDGYTGNNPNEFRTDIKNARQKVTHLQEDLAHRPRDGA